MRLTVPLLSLLCWLLLPSAGVRVPPACPGLPPGPRPGCPCTRRGPTLTCCGSTTACTAPPDCRRLTTVVLHHCTALPPLCPGLARLALSNCSLPASLKLGPELAGLQELDLRANTATAALAEPNLPSLTALYLSGEPQLAALLMFRSALSSRMWSYQQPGRVTLRSTCRTPQSN